MPLDLKQMAGEVAAQMKAWFGERIKALESGLPELVRKQVEALPKPRDGHDADPKLMAAEIARQVALLPKPEKGADADPRLVETLVRSTVDAAMSKIRQPEDGKSVEAAEVRCIVQAEVGRQVAMLPEPQKGKDADPAEILRQVKAAVAELPTPDFAPVVRAEVQRQVGELPRPKDGRDYDETVLKAAIALEVRAAVAALPKPEAGKDADMEALKSTAAAVAREAVAAIPVPKNGEDADQQAIVAQLFDLVMRAMPKPENGKSVTVDDVKPLLEAEVQHWELQFERRAADVLDRLAARYKGKDGIDGFQLEDLQIELKDGRRLEMRLKAGDREVVRQIELNGLPIYKGTYETAQHSAGDMRTYGGSVWMARKDTGEPPRGPSNDWQLVVKGGK